MAVPQGPLLYLRRLVGLEAGSPERWQVVDGIRVDVVATADLPAAGTAQDGRVVIENVGAGDRNLIIYGGGQRFRIDGGVAF
jgi:hypothetical protein